MDVVESKFDFVVNASSLGLNGEKNIIPSNLMDEQTTVYDIVYKPIKTDLINVAEKQGKELFDNSSYYSSIREKIFNYRENRIHPQKDDKILTDWNGLMISALARASYILKNDHYKEAAVKASSIASSKASSINPTVL